ncbi:hypothetical protein [Pontibacter harenae]|uniref:hypothetical protein n=1 Tax=Pontibacter harenae TaxID=2894083 RepID=UPI001E6488F7|nr:hypothetical protein [Pontibacter harenae]MCC9169157.1 hypothetical protein [Pontibacter harenae]
MMVIYCFGTKEPFFATIFGFKFKQINHEVRELGNFESYLKALVRRIETNHGFYQLLRNPFATRQHPATVTLVSKAREQVLMLIRSVGQEGAKTGYFRGVDVDMFAMNVLFLLPYLLPCEMATLIRSNLTLLSQPRRTALANWILPISCHQLPS